MEYLEGETLADVASKGRSRSTRALTITRSRSPTRSTKPIARDHSSRSQAGQHHADQAGAKLLDFGLAKAGARDCRRRAVDAADDAADSPRKELSRHVPVHGARTARGQEADARTDIFAFGAVLYEMLTGRKAFEGKSQANLIAAILKDDPPPMAASQPLTPPMLDRIVKKCLAKEPDKRWQTASDLAQELKWAENKPADAAATEPRRPRAIPLSVAALVAAIVGVGVGVAVWMLKPAPSATTAGGCSSRGHVDRRRAGCPAGYPMALSSDGRQLRRTSPATSVYLRSMDSLASKALAGTEGAQAPFFSPDGQWIGFFAQNKLKRSVRQRWRPTGVGRRQRRPKVAAGGRMARSITLLARLRRCGKSPAVGGSRERGHDSGSEQGRSQPSMAAASSRRTGACSSPPGRVRDGMNGHVHLHVLGTGERQGAHSGRQHGPLRVAQASSCTHEQGRCMTTPSDLT